MRSEHVARGEEEGIHFINQALSDVAATLNVPEVTYLSMLDCNPQGVAIRLESLVDER